MEEEMGECFYLRIDKWTQSGNLDDPEQPVADLDHVAIDQFLFIYVTGVVPSGTKLLKCEITNQGKPKGLLDVCLVTPGYFKGTIEHYTLDANNEYRLIVADILDKPSCLCSAIVKTLTGSP
jgi:hypothetical protein